MIAEKERVLQLERKHKARCDALEDTHLDASIESALDESPVLSPFLPTSAESICAFLDFASITANDIILDIGCGDGRILCSAALVRCVLTARCAANASI
jgi:tRNA G46 methylase TrmB